MARVEWIGSGEVGILPEEWPCATTLAAAAGRGPQDAAAPGYVVGVGKLSADESGKATLIRSAEAHDVVRGAVFEISTDELPSLDAAEGRGYRRLTDFVVRCLRTGEPIETHTYQARTHDSRLKPYDWYLALVMAGSGEHGLGEDYAAALRATPYHADPQPERVSRQRAVHALERAGIADYTRLFAAG